ncbi:hypothetical protein BCR42DRAFT_402954 [Absidia repens]|uniref:Uncharacterized protein n=1 Tax=Absidia repens TaxID=90262 RepID=A0A1X2IYR4_9FUNG|nr:hypothetical protein BCR42DRAFT_402954 [Absidia repens]
MYSIAATPRSLACWLTKQKGHRFSIYYAILAMPHLCDDHFIRLLFNQGALLSRHLVQQLVTLYGKNPTQPTVTSLFIRSIQQLPFSGYAILIHHGFQLYGNILVSPDQDDYHRLMMPTVAENAVVEKKMHAWQEAIHDYCFLPAPVVFGGSSYSRQLIRLADTRPDLFDSISPVFSFDMDACHALWECIFLFLLDLSFTHHSVDHHHEQLACLHRIIKPHNNNMSRFAATPAAIQGPGWYGKKKTTPSTIQKSTPVDDLDIFAHAFISFFAKYPIGYCTDHVMHKLLSLCFKHLHPSFDLRLALTKIMDDLPTMRKDITHQIDQFLKSQS